eukprot:Tbor_TRINITY_DN5869_c0_g5::TRINITY_DN5869_c0_g5_i1::g.6540::m.6540/K00058/serA, PHGDH; D-3-phosphoglycerate dehydrogenase / 2-oxoglutarate reductase
MTIKALLLENIQVSAKGILEDNGISVTMIPKAIGEDEIIKTVNDNDYKIIGIRSKVQLTKKFFTSCPNIIAVGCFCIGINQVDTDSARRSAVPVFNSPFANTRSVAELVIGEIIILSRRIADRSREVHAGSWMKTHVGCYEVRGKTLGIIGYGHIGSQVGVLAEAMGMVVVFYDIQPKLPIGNNRCMKTLDEVLEESDFLTVHVPDTPLTRLMMGAEQFRKMKKGSIFLNLSRGSVVDISALAAAIKEKHIAGCAIDVYPEEPSRNDKGVFRSPLQGLENVIMTPHIGGSTEEAQVLIAQEVSGILVRYISSAITTGAVNFPKVDAGTVCETRQRIIHIHKNIPGVLTGIHEVIGRMKINVRKEVVNTDDVIGCVVLDMDIDTVEQVMSLISKHPATIKCRRVKPGKFIALSKM